MPPPRNQPTPKGDANLTATRASGKDATQGDKTPVPATQDPAGDGLDTAPGEGGTVNRSQPHDSSPSSGGQAQGVPTGKLDQDHDGVAETPEEGQEHAGSTAFPARQSPALPGVPQSRADPRKLQDRESQVSQQAKPKPKEPEGDDDFDDMNPPSTGGKSLKQSAQRAGENAADIEKQAASFEMACEILGRGIKKLTEAGVGGGEAGKLAMEVWKSMD